MKYGYEEHDGIDDDGGGVGSGDGDAHEPVFQPKSNQETCLAIQQALSFLSCYFAITSFIGETSFKVKCVRTTRCFTDFVRHVNRETTSILTYSLFSTHSKNAYQ